MSWSLARIIPLDFLITNLVPKEFIFGSDVITLRQKFSEIL